MTLDDVKRLLATAQACGCKPPDVLADRATFDATAAVYARLLAAAGIDYDTAAAALAAYLGEPNTSGYPKAWPDPGAIIGRTPGALARRSGLARSSELCSAVLRVRGSMGPDLEDFGYEAVFRRLEAITGPLANDVKEAIEVGIDGLGGWYRMGLIETEDRTVRDRWDAAFRRALTEQPFHHAIDAGPAPRGLTS